VLYSGLPDGHAVYALKMHHSMADGHAVMQLLRRLHSTTSEPTRDKPTPAAEPAPELSELDALLRQLRDDAAVVPAVGRKLGSAMLRTSSNPIAGLRGAARYGASLKRVVAPPVGRGSPLLAGRSMSMRLSLIDVPFADFRAAAKAAGGSVNDAFLAALLGGYRSYHEAMGAPVVASIPMGFPISLRKPAIDVMGVLSPALARLPGPVLTTAVGPLTTSLQLMASNVPGIGDGYFLAGARVLRFFGYGRSGAAALITFISSRDVASVGVGFDPAAVTEPTVFLNCLVEGFTEVLELQPGAGKPVLRG
jgi:hypothetical protein